MPSITVENYLKQIYLQQQRNPDELVPMGEIASAMGVVPGTATSMVKALVDSGLVAYEPRMGVRLTKGGEKLALHVLRRHRLVELFLVEVLKLDWSEVHPEAEELEHAISDKVLERIDELLGHPSTDPHGDPIPTAKGKLPGDPTTSQSVLADAPLNTRLRIARVSDQDAPFLQFLDRTGLKPGALVRVERRDDEADSLLVRIDVRIDPKSDARPDSKPPITLGLGAARKIRVEAP